MVEVTEGALIGDVRLGCTYGQGFLYAHPVPASRMDELLGLARRSTRAEAFCARSAAGPAPPTAGGRHPYHDRMRTEIRRAETADIPAVLRLWRSSAAATSTDSADALRGLLRHDPGALLVAVAEEEIVGSVIAGWDGWRGSIYRLAVAPAHRRDRLGSRLLREAEHRLAELGVRRRHAIVVGDDQGAVAFWESTDWEVQRGQLRFAKG